MFMLFNPADAAVADKPAKKVNSKYVVGEIDVSKLGAEDLEKYCALLIRGYNPIVFTKEGKMIELVKRLRREEIENIADIDKALEKKRQESLQDIPAEFLNLSKDDLIDSTERAGMRINWETYTDETLWKVAKRLANKAKKNNWTLDQIKTMPKPEGRTTRVPILFPDINNIPTNAPEGVDDFTLKLFNAIRNSPEFKDTVAQIGRSKGKRANAVLRFDGRNILVGLSQDYSLEEEEEESTAPANA